jgi:hypothetical protein
MRLGVTGLRCGSSCGASRRGSNIRSLSIMRMAGSLALAGTSTGSAPLTTDSLIVCVQTGNASTSGFASTGDLFEVVST